MSISQRTDPVQVGAFAAANCLADAGSIDAITIVEINAKRFIVMALLLSCALPGQVPREGGRDLPGASISSAGLNGALRSAQVIRILDGAVDPRIGRRDEQLLI